MALNFPDSPILNQEYPVIEPDWKWNGYAWERIPIVSGGGSSVPPFVKMNGYHQYPSSFMRTSPLDRVVNKTRQLTLYNPAYSNVQSLLYLNGADNSTSFPDEKGRTWTAEGNAKILTNQSVFGGSSAYFDGAGDTIYTPSDANLEFGSGDFCVEFRFRTPVSANVDIVGKRQFAPNYANGWVIYQNASTLQFYASSTGGTNWDLANGLNTTSNISLNTWYWVIVNRTAGVFRLYLNGNIIGTSAYSASAIFATSNALRIGGNNGGEWFNGWVDNFRVTKGEAVYPANSGIDIPNTPYPNS